MQNNESKKYNVYKFQPDELNELKKVVLDFSNRLDAIDQEISLLKEDRKELIEEYKEKLDIKTFNAVVKIQKIKKSVEHKDTFDLFMEVLDS